MIAKVAVTNSYNMYGELTNSRGLWSLVPVFRSGIHVGYTFEAESGTFTSTNIIEEFV